MLPRNPELSEHTKKIIRWRDSFLLMDEERFFDIMRLYLGEIKTPYNKQKLIESLEGFLRTQANLENMKGLLSHDDIEIMCAVVFIPDCTEQKLAVFFGETFTYSYLSEILLNLEERLILFRASKENKSEKYYELNPHLEQPFYDLFDVKTLLPEVKIKEKIKSENYITPELLLCFLCFTAENPAMSKQDGTLKKHTNELCEKIFCDSKNKIQILFNAFLNLGILKENHRGVEINFSKLEAFSELDFFTQQIYLSVSASSHFSRDGLRQEAQLFIDAVKNLGDGNFTKDNFMRIGYLAAARPSDVESVRMAGSSRFAGMLMATRSGAMAGSDAGNFTMASALELVLENAVVLGLIDRIGKTEDGQDVFAKGKNFGAVENVPESPEGMLSIDSGMRVSLMPGYNLKQMIPLAKFLSVERFDTVCTFTISRQSVMRGFDFGLSVDSILNYIRERIRFKIPELLSAQIEDWNASYSSASFYHGFVLKVEGNLALIAQKNKALSPHIHTVIAPGVFLLDVESEEEAMALIKESGLDFIGRVKAPVYEAKSPDFLRLNILGRVINSNTGFDIPKNNILPNDPKKIEQEMMAVLDSISLEPVQRENLELRISHKVIVNPSQINKATVRIERTAADSMDFSGKNFIISQAMKKGECIEILYNDSSVFGKPVEVLPQQDDVLVQVELIPEGVVREFSVGKAKSVRRIRKNIL